MKRLLLTALAALVLSIFGGTRAYAMEPAGHSFCRGGIPNNEWLAREIEKSLRADPSGNGHVDGCYATVNTFFTAFKLHSSKLQTAKDLPAYIRTFQAVAAKKDYQYSSDCLYVLPNGDMEVKEGCATRDLHPGEIVYKDPDTNELVLLTGCANPGVTEVPPIVVQASPCVEVDYPSMLTPGKRAIRGAWLGQHTLAANKCPIALQMAGESQKRDNLPEECPDNYTDVRDGRMVKIVCAWDDVEEKASELLGYKAQVQNVSFSHYIRATGINRLYLPREALDGETAICYEMPDGSFKTIGVRRQNFVNGVATITPQDVYGQ